MTPAEKLNLHERLVWVLQKHVAPLFTADVNLTLIARKPGNDEADVLITAETDLQQVVNVVERSKARPAVNGD